MTAVAIAMLVVAAIVAVFDRRRRSGLECDVWPWMIAEIEANVRGGHTLPAAVLGVALHGPRALQRAATAARRVRRTSGDGITTLGELQQRAEDPRIDRLCAMVGAVHTFDGDATAVLAQLRAAAVEDARYDRELERARSGLRFAAWVALLPVAAAAWGRLPADAAALAVGAAGWAWTAVLVTGTNDARVFGMSR
jgi:hypothetical protein